MLEHADRFQKELLPGESIHWTGQPDPKVIFHKHDVLMIPFSVLWGGFAIVWEMGVLGYWGAGVGLSSLRIFMALWGIPFVVIGQYLIWGRFLYAAWKKKRVFYAVTNRRVLILASGKNHQLNAAMLATIPMMEKTVRGDGIGTLTFGSRDPRQAISVLSGILTRGTPMFADIANVERVYELVNRLRNEALTAR